ncbi:patatin-like phospholipase family protein [Dactylosporangium sp. CA-233914]|uniref:patatin-like phospholipase family protein n=1 Tax=Dactylosporangium sp. CA-233914 TaxID=3239934 RepID=UPI003D8CEBA7
MTRALVLGGGGMTGIAWEFGILGGLARAGLALDGADVFVGTSAGSVVGTVLAAGIDLEAAVAYQRSASPAPPVDITPALAAFALLADRSITRAEAMAKVGAMALAAPTEDEAAHVARLAAQLPVRDWPTGDLRITAVDTEGGEPIVFDRDSGVPLELAVAASCAVPCVFPPITIGGRRYMDGGVRSGTNADLAGAWSGSVAAQRHRAGSGDVGDDVAAMIVVAPMGALLRPLIDREIAKAGAARSLVIEPDPDAVEAIGPNVLDPSRRAAAVDAGLRQGEALAQSVREVWG